MPRVVFTANLRRHVDAPPALVPGGTVRAALEVVFTQNPRLRGYVLDEQDRVRPHVVLFVDGERAGLDDGVKDSSEIYVLQALSGGSYPAPPESPGGFNS